MRPANQMRLLGSNESPRPRVLRSADVHHRQRVARHRERVLRKAPVVVLAALLATVARVVNLLPVISNVPACA